MIFKPNLSVEVKELTHYYNSYPAVNRISLQIQAGKTFGLLGPNGAGKSTLIKMLTTLLPPTGGRASILGYDIVKEAALVRKNIGYVPQSSSADGDLTGYENLLLSAKLYGIDRVHREQRILEILDFMDLNKFASQLVKQYSGGMIRKLEIAQALLHQPRVLFLDEPTVGLDPVARKTLWNFIEILHKQFETTIVITTHNMDEADLLCEVVAFMHRGHIVIMDSPSNLKASIGPQATLDDVFIQYTGASINQNYNGID